MEDNKQLDLGGFTLYDSKPIQEGNNIEDTKKNILERTIQNIQHIFYSLIEAKKQQQLNIQRLPEEQQIHDFNISKLYLQLPEVSTLFPRSRKIPQAKQLTKWEAFAKSKGIKKRKKTNLSLDTKTKQYVAKWGRNSKKNKHEAPIMQEKAHGRNPFEDNKNNKKLVRQKQKLKQIKNLERRQNKA